MSSEGFQGQEIYNRHTDANIHKEIYDNIRDASKNPADWKTLTTKLKEYPDEVFAAGTDALPQFHGALGYGTLHASFHRHRANDAHQNQIFNDATFDPYAVAFRSSAPIFWRAN